ncbi:MAG: PLP-dependent aminotransferase family protein [Hyphomicrobiales bacterium]|nr:PLP-dependent aminotransferase family protein [Hyphomicrobiales bacterium]
MQLMIFLDADCGRSLQSQLFEQIRGMIVQGRLKASDPIPASRELSEQLGVSRNTVVLAYDRLLAEGYIESKPSVGTFVSTCIPEAGLYLDQQKSTASEGEPSERIPRQRGVVFNGRAQCMVNPDRDRIEIDFWAGRPDSSSFPLKPWRRIINRLLLQAGSRLTEYQDPQGDIVLRQAIAKHLGPARGIVTSPEQVVIVGGIQDGLTILAGLLVDAATTVVLENPCYQGAACVFENRRAEIHPVDVDQRGLAVAELPELRNSIAYVTPSHQHPTGATLSLDRRIAILEWALRTRSYIIEDDYDSDFRYSGSPLTALKGLDKHGSVIYLGTFSKCMGAALRLGYLVVPKELVEAARALKALESSGQPWLEQAAMAEFIESGEFARHLRRIRQTYMKRRDHLVDALHRQFGDVELAGLDGGMHFTWQLPPDWPTADEISARALAENVGVYSTNNGAACTPGDQRGSDHCLVLGYCALSEEQISEGVRRLGTFLPRIEGAAYRLKDRFSAQLASNS